MAKSTSDQTRVLSHKDDVFQLKACQLVVISGKDRKKTISLDRDILCLGSLETNDVTLKDDSISRNHCELRRERDGYHIVDLQSTNGTFVNETRIQDALLQGGEVIRMGETELRFKPISEDITLYPSEDKQFGDVLGSSMAMRKLFTLLHRVSPTDITILIQGETGTGKELLAKSIHDMSQRAKGPFRAFDCGAVAPNLIESELFGHEKGAFTGADQVRKGVFEASHGGTVFLDEIGELTVDLQPKLLRVLEQREIRKLGSNQSISIDIRIIAATNRDLEEEVKEGRFREDLFFRLAVIGFELPPLRERREDIAHLAELFISTQDRPIKISPEAISVLKSCEWPGNVRELRNVLERAVALADGPTLDPKDLMLSEAHRDQQKEDENFQVAGRTLEEIEKVAIQATLDELGWNKKAASQSLGIAYSTLHEKIKKYQLKKG